MFYTFRQNNSGGTFVENWALGIGRTVIVEADSCDEANQIAEQIGLYFDGVGDCLSCCGPRWRSVDRYNMDVDMPVPTLWEEPVDDDNDQSIYIHRRNCGLCNNH